MRAEDENVDQARDHGRDGERQIDERDENLLAGNSNLVMAQAAAMPKTTLSGTRDGRRQQRQLDGESASGSTKARDRPCQPFRKRFREHDDERSSRRKIAKKPSARPRTR